LLIPYHPNISLKRDLKRARKVTLSKKRKSRGRSKGGKGRSDTVYCSNCGAAVPRDKAKRVTTRLSLVEPTLARELRQAGAYIAAPTTTRFYCISCSVHYGIVKVRAKNERRGW
jgi:small subunit ribosomal protein S26e